VTGLALLSAAVLVACGCASQRGANGASVGTPVDPSKSSAEISPAVLAAGIDLGQADLEAKLALQGNPLDARSHRLLGCLLALRGEEDQAAVAFDRALALDATNSETLYNLGTLLLRRGEAAPAARLLEDAASLRPGHVPTWNNLAKAYFEVGLPELAVASYEEALLRGPSNARALANLARLADAAGLEDAAAAYRGRLASAGLAVDRSDRATALPIWPVALADARVAAPEVPSAAFEAEAEAPEDVEVADLRDLLRDLRYVTVERRGGRLTLTGWTSSAKERDMLDRVLGQWPGILDLTGDDTADTDRMLEVDAVILIMTDLSEESVGFNLLKLISLNFNYFATDHGRDGSGYSAPPAVTGAVQSLAQQGWIFSASVDYLLNIANASLDRVAVLARPHLTTVSGTPAKFLAGGELVYSVSGLNSGDIKPYPFGTTLTVTPTLLRTPGPDGVPRVRMTVEAGRTSALDALIASTDRPTSFTKVTVDSEAVLGLGRTLILSGFSQRESRTGREGVPGLMQVPILKYFFSRKTTLQSDAAVIILLTPRDPRFWDEQNRKEIAGFVEMRRAFLEARKGTPADLESFRERYPAWQELPPSRYGAHFFLLASSELYRAVSGEDLEDEGLDYDALALVEEVK
jgi:Flp pilus assembly protein TadD